MFTHAIGPMSNLFQIHGHVGLLISGQVFVRESHNCSDFVSYIIPKVKQLLSSDLGMITGINEIPAS